MAVLTTTRKVLNLMKMKMRITIFTGKKPVSMFLPISKPEGIRTSLDMVPTSPVPMTKKEEMTF